MEGAITSNIHRMGSQSLVLFKYFIAPNIWQPDHEVDDKINQNDDDIVLGYREYKVVVIRGMCGGEIGQ